jgi:[acyl-carrier-protein] S-malonyltransferase
VEGLPGVQHLFVFNMKKFIITFPGQGSQSIGMMKGLSETTVIKDTFAEASDLLGVDFLNMVTSENNQINKTINTQPLMLTVGIATWRYLLSIGVGLPSYGAGHSLGEFTALVAAEALTFEDGLKLVLKRAELMQDAVPENEGAMAAILGLDDELVIDICKKHSMNQILEAVNFNSPGQVVVAGNKRVIEASLNFFKDAGAKRAIIVPVSVPSHCSLMKPASIKFKEYLNNILLKLPNFPVIQNYQATSYDETEMIKDALVFQMFNPVRWTETIKNLSKQKVSIFVESAPGKILTGLNKRINKEVSHASVDSVESANQFLLQLK